MSLTAPNSPPIQEVYVSVPLTGKGGGGGSTPSDLIIVTIFDIIVLRLNCFYIEISDKEKLRRIELFLVEFSLVLSRKVSILNLEKKTKKESV